MSPQIVASQAVKTLDPVIHAPLRLTIVTILSRLNEATFIYLRDMTNTTDGNLALHLKKLEKAKYISSAKAFVNGKSQTTYTLLPDGRKALLAYIARLKRLLNPPVMAALEIHPNTDAGNSTPHSQGSDPSSSG